MRFSHPNTPFFLAINMEKYVTCFVSETKLNHYSHVIPRRAASLNLIIGSAGGEAVDNAGDR